jgi:hypothetical protein
MTYLETILGLLAVWRVTHLLLAEDGPWDLSVRLRRAAGPGFWGKLLDCFQCLSLWVAAPAALVLARGWRDRPLLWLALSGGAILLERATGRPDPFPTTLVSEDEQKLEVHDELLRQEPRETVPAGVDGDRTGQT